MDKRSVFQSYVLNTSFHGLRYIVEKERHWTERVFWIVCVTLSWLASGLLMQSAWNNYQNNAISFVVDTRYLDWDTNFPSISVCETDNQDKIAKATDRVYGDPHDYNLDEIVKETVYFKGLLFYTLQMCGPEAPMADENCFKKNITEFSKEIRSTCDELFKECRWNGKKFDCCQYFAPLETEFGICYSINSMQSRDKSFKRFPMISNRKNGQGKLYLEINGYTDVYILGEQEVPSFSTLTSDILSLAPNLHYHRYFALKEIENDAEVKNVDIYQRKCKLDGESDGLDVFPYYSYSACCVQCRKNAQVKMCDCSQHLMPNTRNSYSSPEKRCNMDGLFCLSKRYKEINVLKAPWSNKTGLVCECLPSCTELEISTINEEKNVIAGDYSIVEFSLERLPTERYKRYVVKGHLDLVVSMGGVAALFLGASILSFVETLYYFLIRPYFTYLKNNDQPKYWSYKLYKKDRF